MPDARSMRYYPAVGPAIPRKRAGRSRVTHPFAGRGLPHALDLHVLSTPPAFVLSQDQTLHRKLDPAENETSIKARIIVNRKKHQTQTKKDQGMSN